MKFKVLWIAGLMLAATAGQVQAAGVIMSPTSVIANTIGEFNNSYDVGNMIDQSGLSTGFISGTSDFNTYIGGGPTHVGSDNANAMWFGPGRGPFTGYLDFDMGSTVQLFQLALWNGAIGSTANINSFTVLTSTNAGFATPTNVGTFTNPQGVGATPYSATVFDLTDSTAEYVRILINSYYGNPNVVGIGEVAFDTGSVNAAVPEPASIAMWTLGAIGLMFARRKRQETKLTM